MLEKYEFLLDKENVIKHNNKIKNRINETQTLYNIHKKFFMLEENDDIYKKYIS
jgi:3-methyladenine DNA glycosylase Tag